jgi:hypothetical protein
LEMVPHELFAQNESNRDPPHLHFSST